MRGAAGASALEKAPRLDGRADEATANVAADDGADVEALPLLPLPLPLAREQTATDLCELDEIRRMFLLLSDRFRVC